MTTTATKRGVWVATPTIFRYERSNTFHAQGDGTYVVRGQYVEVTVRNPSRHSTFTVICNGVTRTLATKGWNNGTDVRKYEIDGVYVLEADYPNQAGDGAIITVSLPHGGTVEVFPAH